MSEEFQKNYSLFSQEDDSNARTQYKETVLVWPLKKYVDMMAVPLLSVGSTFTVEIHWS